MFVIWVVFFNSSGLFRQLLDKADFLLSRDFVERTADIRSDDDALSGTCIGKRKLKPKLERLQPGTIVISNTFSIYGWTAAQTLQVRDLYRSPVYIYRIGSERQESSKSARRESKD